MNIIVFTDDDIFIDNFYCWGGSHRSNASIGVTIKDASNGVLK